MEIMMTPPLAQLTIITSMEHVIAQIVAWEKLNSNYKGVTTMGVFTHCHLSRRFSDDGNHHKGGNLG
jgi:hypothetical protein